MLIFRAARSRMHAAFRANDSRVLDLKLDRPPAPPKDAATVLLLRDASEGVEVFCVERSKQSRFLGGAIVFPGGKLDDTDASEEWEALTTPARAATVGGTNGNVPFATDGLHLRALAVAACRETLEEAAILPFAGSGSAMPTQEDLFALRTRLTTDPHALRTFLRERGVRLDLEALHPFSRWVTPEAEARRYDARFFLAVAPAGQSGAHDEHETMASFWATPSEVLRRWAAGDVQIAPPTHRTLFLLADCNTTREALARAEASCRDPICPRLVPQRDGEVETMALTLPGDPEHGVAEVRVAGPSRYVLRGKRWVAENAPS